ncbi:MAG: hypothetical protein IH612_05625 [Desulfofustis sp.]|nr:hypothetical protein [Desulfofustis sp.]
MNKFLRAIILALLICFWGFAGYGQDVSREQLKGLDEQVQEIKGDILSIAVELNQLEEKLLYPSNSQLSLFIALAEGERFRLDAVKILLDGQPVAQYLYTFKELEALRMGGVQRIYTGNIKTGEHAVEVSFSGKDEGGNALERAESFKVRKQVGPSIVAITLADQGITLNDR